MIGIIGGSGLDDPELLKDFEERKVSTPYGDPSSPFTIGKLNGVEVAILARHGRKHSIPPSQVPFKANMHAFKTLGVKAILASTAVGSLREEIQPGHLVFPSQFIDFTKHRSPTFYDKDEVVHTPMAEPFSPALRKVLCEEAGNLGFAFHTDKTVVTIEGPRFSTKAESHFFRLMKADIINMSVIPEAILAREASIPYQPIAMSTDYDCWRESEESVTWELIQQRMRENAGKVKELLLASIPRVNELALP